MALLFEATGHTYYLDGLVVPSVTQILRELGLINFDHVPPRILEDARRRGSDVHALIHYSNEDDLDDTSIDPDYRGYLAAWRACRATRGIAPILCEYRIASRRHRFAGTLDCLCAIGGDGWLLDYATGDPDDVAKHLQTAAYHGLMREWATGDPVLAETLARFRTWRRASVRLRSDGTYQFREYTDPRHYGEMLTLVAAWHIRAAHRGAAQELAHASA